MSSQKAFAQPAPFAVWLITLFTPLGDAEAIPGDLLEEFSQIALQSGPSLAERWYWKQTVKTMCSLTIAAFQAAPWTISAIVLGAFLLRWFVSRLTNPTVDQAIEDILEKYRVYDHSPQTYIFWFTHTFLAERLIVNTLTGVVVATLAKGREMVSTIALGLFGDLLALQAVLMGVSKTGDHGLLWTLPWSFAFSLAIVVGGAIVRTRRMPATAQPSHT